jgi:hypothetical protein
MRTIPNEHPAKGNRGVVLSALEEQVFVFGGTTTGILDGPTYTTAARLNLATSSWTTFNMINETGRPGHIEAATFRYQDGNVYYLTRRSSGALELGRWRALRNLPNAYERAFEPLATFPASWQSYTSMWMRAGANDELVVAFSGSAGHKVALFEVDPTGGGLHFLSGYVGSGRLRREPIVRQEGLVLFKIYSSSGSILHDQVVNVLWDDFGQISDPP